MTRRRRANVSAADLDAVLDGRDLTDEASHYLIRVLRLRAGDRVELGDGSGRVVVGRLERAGRVWRLARPRLAADRDDTVPIVLAAGLLKPKRWSLLVEKSVELGVRRLVPLVTQHAAVRPGPTDVPALLERWHRVALQAAKQCRRAAATRVEAPRAIDEWLRECEANNRLVADPEGGEWPAEALRPLGTTALLIGPEGGLDEAERAAARDAGFAGVTLGGFTLRAETAAIVLAAMARDRLGFAGSERRDDPCP